MSKNILIVDDDADFNSLLTDVFRQTDYNAVAVLDPRQAVEIFSQNHFDLVISDYLMPEMTGVEFIRAIRKIRDDVPIVLVSGFLKKSVIKELLEEEVEGIFLKPLNVFSLLKNSLLFIEDPPAPDMPLSDETEEFYRQDLIGHTISFPCKSVASRDFISQLYASRNFASTLLLEGEKGSQFQRICQDLGKFSHQDGEQFYFLPAKAITPESLKKDLQKLGVKTTGRITLVALNTEKLGEEERSLLCGLAQREKPFDDLPGQYRFVFCLTRKLEDILDKGRMDERFYRFLSSAKSKITVPPLRDCPEDLFFMGRQILKEEAENTRLPRPPMIEGAAIDYLKNRKWPGNFDELRELLQITMKMGNSLLLEVDDFRKAQEFKDLHPKNVAIENLREYVKKNKEGYTGTVYNLLQGDSVETNEAPGINTETAQKTLPKKNASAPKG